MTDSKTERATWRFVAEKAEGGRPIIRVQLFHATIPLLKDVRLGFNLLSGISLEQAQKIADNLNECVLDIAIVQLSEHPLVGTE